MQFTSCLPQEKIPAESSIPYTKYVVMDGGRVHSQSFCADYCRSQWGVLHLPSVSKGWSSWAETAQQRQTQSPAGLAAVQDCSGLCRTTSPQSGPFSLSNPANTRSMEIPLLHFFFEITPLAQWSTFIAGYNFIQILLALNICTSCVLSLPHPLFPAFPEAAWGLFCSSFAVESCFLSCWRTSAQ